jgi:hypothetical protein
MTLDVHQEDQDLHLVLHSVFIFLPALVRIMDGYKVDAFFVLCASF